MAAFSIAGSCAARALGITGDRQSALGRWMMTPALGLVFYGSFAFVSLWMIHYSLATVIGTWVVFNGAALWLARLRTTETVLQVPRNLSNRTAAIIIALAALGATLPPENIYPFTSKGALYNNTMLADHVKIAFTDGIAREGMPLKNPFYAPAGKRILLSYSYAWYLPGAMLKTITRCSGWQAEVAMSWFTTFAIALFLAALACALADQAAAGFWLLLIFGVGPMSSDLLVMILGPRWMPFVGLPKSHGLEVPWLQLAWAPQHVYGAMAVFVTLWLASAALATAEVATAEVNTAALVDTGDRLRLAIAMGLSISVGFEASSWVGGIALLAASPLLIVGIALLRLPRNSYINFARTFLIAAAFAALITLPLLLVLTRGTPQAEHEHTLGFDIFPSTQLEDAFGLTGTPKMLLRIVLYWVHLLPLSFGVMFLVGLPAMLAWVPRSDSDRTFRAISIAATFGFLLVSQFLASKIRANDLGWRACNVAEMFLSIFAAVAVTDLLQNRLNSPRWRFWNGWNISQPIALPLVLGLLTLGLLSTARVAGVPAPVGKVPREVQAFYSTYAWQSEAWKAVRRLTHSHDLVQANPEAFDNLPPWPISLPYHLFADRSAAYSCDGTARTYAFLYSWQDNLRQHQLVSSVFTHDPPADAIRALHAMNVKAILVTPADANWNSTALQRSGLYRLRVRNHHYKVYIRLNKPTAKPTVTSKRSASPTTQSAHTSAAPPASLPDRSDLH